MKSTLSAFICSTIFAAGLAFAQEANEVGADNGSAEQASIVESDPCGGQKIQATVMAIKSPRERLEDVAAKAGIKKASRKGKVAFAIMNAPIGVKPTDKDYATARQMAYDRALLNAKQEIARQLAAQIASSAELAINIGKLSDAKTKVADKAQYLVNQKIGEMMKAEGVDLSDAAAVKAAMPKVLSSEEFKQSAEVAASAYMIGVQCFASDSDEKSIYVLATYSDFTRRLAMAMFTGEKIAIEGAKKVDNLDEEIDSIKPVVLANTFGLKTFIESDDDGDNNSIVVFTQAFLASDSGSAENIAQGKARLMAEKYYREFAGQTVTVAAALSQAQNITALEQGLGELSSIDEQYGQKCQAIGSKLSIKGILSLSSQKLRLPSGHAVLCRSFVWTPDSGALGNDAMQKNNEAKAAIESGKIAYPAKNPATKKPAATKVPAKKRKSNYEDTHTTGSGYEGGVF